MADIFVSYGRSTEAQAQLVADTLRSAGYTVWRDDELPAHRAYSDVIEERLRSAKAVVVLWSAEAAKSQWVRAEADIAREAGTLVQVSVDGVLPPLPFNQIQCAALDNWTGDTSAPGWQKVESSIALLVGAPKPAASSVDAKGTQ
jgi:adenylate cyclase